MDTAIYRAHLLSFRSSRFPCGVQNTANYPRLVCTFKGVKDSFSWEKYKRQERMFKLYYPKDKYDKEVTTYLLRYEGVDGSCKGEFIVDRNSLNGVFIYMLTTTKFAKRKESIDPNPFITHTLDVSDITNYQFDMDHLKSFLVANTFYDNDERNELKADIGGRSTEEVIKIMVAYNQNANPSTLSNYVYTALPNPK